MAVSRPRRSKLTVPAPVMKGLLDGSLAPFDYLLESGVAVLSLAKVFGPFWMTTLNESTH